MRVFWMIMAVLAIGVALLWYLRAPVTRPVDIGQLDVPPLDGSAQAPEYPRVVGPRGGPVQLTPTEPGINVTLPLPSPVPAAVPETKPVNASEQAMHDDDHDAIGPVTESVLVPGPASLPDPFIVIPIAGAATPKPVAKTAKAMDKPDAAAAAKVTLEPQDDGSTLVDGKYIIKGEGTKENPYRVTWEMLISSEETYRPRLGKKVIPERVKMLDGKWIKISGYIAFPIMATSGDEMLMMLNQWDGCCIGVPPTPYDAIEVKLKTAAKGQDRLRVAGTLVGKFRVDPYLVKDWLISLYVMDDGELSDLKGEAAPPGMHAGNGP